jgi:autotransporter-associated beta strand protein
MGTLHVARGQSFVVSTAGSGASSTTVTFGKLTRDASATVDFSGTGLGSASSRLVFTQAPTTVGSNGGVLPYATFTGTTQDFATYNGSSGVTAFTGYASTLASAGASDIVLLTSSASLTANKSVAALLMRGSPTLTINPGVTLTLQNGLVTTGTSATINAAVGAGTAAVNFGAEGIIQRFTSSATAIKTAIGGSSALVLSGTGELDLEPPLSGNTWTGGTTLNSGKLSIKANNTPLGAAAGTLNLRGGVLDISVFLGDVTFPQPVVLSNTGISFASLNEITFSGPVTLSGRNIVAVPGGPTVNLTGKVSGTGSLVVTAATGSGSGGGILALTNAANNYTGGTTLSNSGIFSATLELGGNKVLGTGPLFLHSGNLQASTAVTISNAIVLGNDSINDTIVGAINFTGSNDIALAGDVDLRGINTLKSDVPDVRPVTISGNMSGSGGINKIGAGTLTLAGANTYTGATSVAAGVLLVNGDQPSSNVAVTAGTLGGLGSVGYLSVDAAGIVAPGIPGGAFGSLSPSGANFSAGGTLALGVESDAAGSAHDALDLGSGRLLLGASSALSVDLTGVTAERSIPGLVRYGSRIGSVTEFAQADLLNNTSGHTAELDYTSTQLNLAVATGLNQPPVISNPATQPATEDVALVFSAANSNAISISDPDAGANPVQLTLTAGHGKLTLAGLAGLTFLGGDGTSDATMTIVGTISDINTALDGLTFRLDTNYAGAASLTIDANDLGSLGLGGEQTDSAAININASPTNDAGSVTIVGTAKEDLTLTANVADIDGIGGAITYQWQSGTGSTFTNISGATSSTFQPGDAQVGQKVRVKVTYTDDQSFVENLTSAATAVVVGVNDAPTIGGFGSAITYFENGVPKQISTTATVTDPDSLNLDGGKLTIRLSANAKTEDRLTIKAGGSITLGGASVLFSGTAIGSFTGGTGTTPLVVTLLSAATPIKMQALLRAIAYSNVSENPSTAVRTVTVTLTDGDGGTSAAATKSINVTPVNDKPVLGGISDSIGYVHNATTPITLAASATVTDVDSANFATGRLRVHFTATSSTNRLKIGGNFSVADGNVKLNGVVIGKLTSNGFGTKDLIVTFTSAATKLIVQQLVRSIKFSTVGAVAGSRTVAFSVSDGDGGTSTEVSKTVNLT